MLTDCHVCDGHYTIESLLTLQLDGVLQPRSIPLCPEHHKLMEGALYEMRNIKTPPVIINLAGLPLNGRAGRTDEQRRAVVVQSSPFTFQATT